MRRMRMRTRKELAIEEEAMDEEDRVRNRVGQMRADTEEEEEQASKRIEEGVWRERTWMRRRREQMLWRRREWKRSMERVDA